uniref:ZF-HD dimerization-type domain-containing protein n=1 Tax=Kalanchoe fedtschenkoi TaxID=63787 RepID=A0A7N0TFT5_KALFE
MNANRYYYDGCCNRNWAAQHGLVVRDGCRQYVPEPGMPNRCFVCGCHRHFHQRCVFLGMPSNPPPPPAQEPPTPPPPQRQPRPLNVVRQVEVHAREGNEEPQPFRRFTSDQLTSMELLAEEINWDISRLKMNNDELAEACHPIGVTVTQFKRWVRVQKRKRRIRIGGRNEAGASGTATGSGGCHPAATDSA